MLMSVHILTKVEPILIDVEKGAWFKIGIALQNPTDEDIVVGITVENVKVRIELATLTFKFLKMHVSTKYCAEK